MDNDPIYLQMHDVTDTRLYLPPTIPVGYEPYEPKTKISGDKYRLAIIAGEMKLDLKYDDKDDRNTDVSNLDDIMKGWGRTHGDV